MPSCDEDEAKLSARGHACVAVERDCKFVRDEDEDNCETGCFEGDDMSGTGECWTSRQVWLEGGDLSRRKSSSRPRVWVKLKNSSRTR